MGILACLLEYHGVEGVRAWCDFIFVVLHTHTYILHTTYHIPHTTFQA